MVCDADVVGTPLAGAGSVVWEDLLVDGPEEVLDDSWVGVDGVDGIGDGVPGGGDAQGVVLVWEVDIVSGAFQGGLPVEGGVLVVGSEGVEEERDSNDAGILHEAHFLFSVFGILRGCWVRSSCEVLPL